MGFYQHKHYLEFATALDSAIEKGANLLIVCVPGMSVTYFLKKFLERKKDSKIKYISASDERLEEFNVLDLNFDKNPDGLALAESYFKQATLRQKFALVINTPQLLDSQEFQNSYVASHITSIYQFHTLDLEMVKIFAEELHTKLPANSLQNVLTLTGGIGRLVKFIVINKDLLNLPLAELIQREDLKLALLPSANVISQCDQEILKRLGIKTGDSFTSQILAKYFETNPTTERISIRVNPDLTFYEQTNLSKNRLNKTEAQILKFMVENQGVVTKEKISEIKWGEGEYDKFSDQAIGKTMQRLGKKLVRYKLEVIPSVGYKLKYAGGK